MRNTINVFAGKPLDHRTLQRQENPDLVVNVRRGAVAAHDKLLGQVEMFVLHGGSISDVRVGDVSHGGSLLEVYARGSATGTIVDGSYNSARIYGVATDTTVENGASEEVDSGGSQIGGRVEFATITVASGGIASGLTVRHGGEIVQGGTSVDTHFTQDGTQSISYSGVATSSYFDQSSTQTIANGGTAIDTVLGSHGVSIVSAGGVANGVTIGRKGLQIVSSGGAVSAVTVQSGGTLLILPGGRATDITAAAGGHVVSSGIVIDHGTSVTIVNGDLGRHHPVMSGETEYILAGARSTQPVLSGGIENVYGFTRNSLVEGFVAVQSGGFTKRTRVSGGALTYSAGGVGRHVAIVSGELNVQHGATVTQARLFPDATAAIQGYVHGLHFDNGGFADVLSGGLVRGAMVSGGGTLLVDGGHAHAITLLPKGTLEFAKLHARADATVTLGSNNRLTIAQDRPDGTRRVFTIHLAGNYTGATFAVSAGADHFDAITRVQAAAIPLPDAADLRRDITAPDARSPYARTPTMPRPPEYPAPSALRLDSPGDLMHDLLPHIV